MDRAKRCFGGKTDGPGDRFYLRSKGSKNMPLQLSSFWPSGVQAGGPIPGLYPSTFSLVPHPPSQ